MNDQITVHVRHPEETDWEVCYVRTVNEALRDVYRDVGHSGGVTLEARIEGAERFTVYLVESVFSVVDTGCTEPEQEPTND